jgi:hypothetical protein
MVGIKQLDMAARDLVGDGKSPNLFFVSVDGKVRTITSEFDIAYDLWRSLRGSEATLEDRKHGVLASVENHVVMDDTYMLTGRPNWRKD